MIRFADGGGWERLPDGDSRLRSSIEPEPQKNCIMKVLYIYKNQIMYDVDSQVNMVTNMRAVESGKQNNAANFMLDKYNGMFDRWIDKHIDKVKERLSIAVMDIRNDAMGDELKEWSEKELRLSMPHWWDDTAWKPLVSAVHDYITNAVVMEYFKIVLPNDPVTVNKMEDAADSYDKIKVLLCKHKQGSIKKPLRALGF